MNPYKESENIYVVRNGNLFHAHTEAIVNPVNCVGVSGKGLALIFKQKYPDNDEAYKLSCTNNRFEIGDVLSHPLNTNQPPYYIINFPTKNHWRHPSELSYIQKGLVSLIVDMKIHKINSVAIPKLGCGKDTGQLNWSDVKPLIIDIFNSKMAEELICHIYE